MRSGVLLSAICLSLAIAGCGGSGSVGGDKTADGVRATIRAYLDDIKNGHGGDACDLLTDAVRARIGSGNAAACGSRIVLARALLGEKAIAGFEAKVGQLKITITGNHATAPAITPGSGTTNLVYTGGHWLIDGNS